jgi:hypothetical protein
VLTGVVLILVNASLIYFGCVVGCYYDDNDMVSQSINATLTERATCNRLDASSVTSLFSVTLQALTNLIPLFEIGDQVHLLYLHSSSSKIRRVNRIHRHIDHQHMPSQHL